MINYQGTTFVSDEELRRVGNVVQTMWAKKLLPDNSGKMNAYGIISVLDGRIPAPGKIVDFLDVIIAAGEQYLEDDYWLIYADDVDGQEPRIDYGLFYEIDQCNEIIRCMTNSARRALRELNGEQL